MSSPATPARRRSPGAPGARAAASPSSGRLAAHAVRRSPARPRPLHRRPRWPLRCPARWWRAARRPGRQLDPWSRGWCSSGPAYGPSPARSADPPGPVHRPTPAACDRAGCDAQPARAECAGVSAGDDLALLLDLGGLAAQLAEVVQLGPADVTPSQHLDLLDDRGVHREGALHADAEADLAHGEGLADAAALATQDDALEDLDAGAVALDDPHVHLHGVPGAEVGDVVAERRGVEGVQGVHRSSPQS